MAVDGFPDYLVTHARQTFDPTLSLSEEAVLRDAATLVPTLLTSHPRQVRRPIRASMIRWLVVHPDNVRIFDSRVLIIQSAHVVGDLDLVRCRHVSGIQFHECLFDEALLLAHAEIDSIHFSAVELKKGLVSVGLRASGGVFMEEVHSQGALFLSSSHFGSLRLQSLNVNVGPVALDLRESRCDRSFEILNTWLGGTLDLARLSVGGSLYTERLSIHSSHGALKLDDADVQGSAHLTGLICSGPLRIAERA